MNRNLVVAMSGVTVFVAGASFRASQHQHHLSVSQAAPAGVVTPAQPAPASAATDRHQTRHAAPRLVAPAPYRTRPSPAAITTSAAAPARQAVTTAPRPVPATTHSRSPTPAPSRTPPPSVTVNGAAADTQYGPVQVQITVRGGRIVRADAIVYPQDSQRDQEINSQAVPQLNDETLQAQSAQIASVSGATYTSGGYQQSLQSALDAAHRAGAL